MSVHRAFFVALLCASNALGADVEYERDIKPLLHEKCSACHGALKQESGLRLDAATLILEGGDSGAAIDIGNASGSLLLYRVMTEDTDERMPPEGEGERLNPGQLELLKDWINAGAIAPENETIPSKPSDHWAYQIPKLAPIPENENTEFQTNPVDAFISSIHRREPVESSGVADKRTLVRRLYFDLIGLPPTRRQVSDFVNDHSADAYERLAETLLANPLYGERWGRHWMDVWRYSDWDGYKQQLRGSQRHIWRWRDWIIESLNQDKGYDQMIVEMLAGDELAPTDFNVLRATGFLARNYHKSNRDIWLDATVEHTAKAFLGMTLNCARCHDHKFDPLAQSEYYAMRAIFEPHNVRTERLPGQRNLTASGLPRVFDAEPDAKTFLYVRGNEKHFDESSPVDAAIPAVFNQTLEVHSVDLPPLAVFPSLSPHIETEDIQRAKQQVAAAKRQHAKSNRNKGDSPSSVSLALLGLESATANLKSLVARWAADKTQYEAENPEDFDRLATIAAQAERAATLAKSKLDLFEKETKLNQAKSSDEADSAKKMETLKKAKKAFNEATKQFAEAETALSIQDQEYTSVGKSYPRQSTGRRLALAKWIADSKNPLTARVAINHLWLRHFGEPLVPNTFDFGLRSPRPKHVDLLDWLAVELMNNQWSMKHIHRLLVTSRTYKLRSFVEPSLAAENHAIDPDNKLFWRANVRRLDAEVVRDSLLHLGGSLDLQQGGPDIDANHGETETRRSVYFRHAYEKQMTMLVLFDAAGPNECYRRSESIIPQQALTLANSSLSLSESRRLTQTLWSKLEGIENPDIRFVQLAFQQMLARSPSDEEITACLEFLSQQSIMLINPSSLTEFGGKTIASVPPSTDPRLRAKENLIHVLMNHNDFVTVR